MTKVIDRDVSVVIPTRNRGEKLSECLGALARQTLPADRFEVVVVDNGSDDGSYAKAERAAGETPFRTRVVFEPRRGPAAARNCGIEHAQGRRILFLGDDILASPDLMHEHLAAAEQHAGAAVLGFTDWAPHLRPTPFMRYLAPERGPQFRYATIADPMNCGYHFFYTSNLSLERRWFDLERFDPAFPYACLEDADLGYRLEKRGLRIVFHRPALAYHDHVIRFRDFLERMKQQGESNVIFYRKYPEKHSDPDAIPSEGYRVQFSRRRAWTMALRARFIAAADRLGIALSERTYERVLEYYYVRAFFAALDASEQTNAARH